MTPCQLWTTSGNCVSGAHREARRSGDWRYATVQQVIMRTHQNMGHASAEMPDMRYLPNEAPPAAFAVAQAQHWQPSLPASSQAAPAAAALTTHAPHTNGLLPAPNGCGRLLAESWSGLNTSAVLPTVMPSH